MSETTKSQPRNRTILGLTPGHHLCSLLLRKAYTVTILFQVQWVSQLQESLPLDGCRRLGGDIQNHTVDACALVGDSSGDGG